MEHKKISRSVGIHDGAFHADEVSACALLIIFNLIDRDRIVRTRDKDKLAKCEYVCDVGGIYDPDRKLFDHHQVDYEGDLSSAGMILLYLKDQNIITEDIFNLFNDGIIKGVDAHDNGRSLQEVGYCYFSHIVANFAPIQHEVSSNQWQESFDAALDFAIGHLTRMLERHKYTLRCQEIVAKTMQKYRTCLIFDRSLPWLDSFFALNGKQHSAFFVIMPAGEHWKLRGIPPDYEHRMQVRVPLPLEWAGLLEDKLKEVCGIPGAVFCHKGRFTSVWETKEDALKALAIVLEKNGLKNEDNL